jgi:hypothetical protein
MKHLAQPDAFIATHQHDVTILHEPMDFLIIAIVQKLKDSDFVKNKQ